MTFEELSKANRERCEEKFHNISVWRPSQWSNAMAGECGEACNLTKKMDRIWPSDQFHASWNKPEDARMEELVAKLATEIADVVIYADLLASRVGLNLGEIVRAKFNSKSEEIGSNIRL